jgi:hypothetical protein
LTFGFQSEITMTLSTLSFKFSHTSSIFKILMIPWLRMEMEDFKWEWSWKQKWISSNLESLICNFNPNSSLVSKRQILDLKKIQKIDIGCKNFFGKKKKQMFILNLYWKFEQTPTPLNFWWYTINKVFTLHIKWTHFILGPYLI